MESVLRDTFVVSPPAPAPAPPPLPAPDERRGFLPMLLGDHAALSAALQDPLAFRAIVPKLLGVSVLGFVLHGLVAGVAAELFAADPAAGISLGGHPALWMPIAFTLSLVGALGICLPIFAFCSQVAGLDVPLPVVAAQALRANATSSALLLGLVAYALGCVLHLFGTPALAVGLGLALPFVLGLFGIRAVYKGFSDLARAMPEGLERRRGLLRVMVFSAALVYAAVAPIALWRLAQALGGL
jgi:hypothetical protein